MADPELQQGGGLGGLSPDLGISSPDHGCEMRKTIILCGSDTWVYMKAWKPGSASWYNILGVTVKVSRSCF